VERRRGRRLRLEAAKDRAMNFGGAGDLPVVFVRR
jgi:hypothetical protein